MIRDLTLSGVQAHANKLTEMSEAYSEVILYQICKTAFLIPRLTLRICSNIVFSMLFSKNNQKLT